MSAAAGERAKAHPRGAASTGREDKTIFGTPERFMRPRLVLIACVAVLVAFGILMIYSASSVTAMEKEACGYDAAYYAKRQLVFACVGAVVAVILAISDYHLWCRTLLLPIWVLTAVLLALVMVVGSSEYGATRWISVGGFSLQPSEFAKLTVILTAANVAESYFDKQTLTWNQFVALLVVGVGVPIVLIFVQPDKGSAIILCVTLLIMGYLAGFPRRILGALVVLAAVGFLVISLSDSYSRERIMIMLDPWSDPYDDGYQLIQGWYAFASGGIFGVGIGMSSQKYSYLPMAYNDFIYAVIGEECGLVGTLAVVAAFLVILWAGLQIAEHANDMSGRLVAAGASSLLMFQFLVNVMGVLGLFPLSGKPIPFLSYGGSSIIASLMLVGFIVSVSIHSRLPETVHDERRRELQVSETPSPYSAGPGLSLVGEPTPRSARPATRGTGHEDAQGGRGSLRGDRSDARDPGAVEGQTSSGEDDVWQGFRVVDGGQPRASRSGTRRSGTARSGSGSDASRGRVTTDANGRQRVDLGPSAADRLRPTSRDRDANRDHSE